MHATAVAAALPVLRATSRPAPPAGSSVCAAHTRCRPRQLTPPMAAAFAGCRPRRPVLPRLPPAGRCRYRSWALPPPAAAPPSLPLPPSAAAAGWPLGPLAGRCRRPFPHFFYLPAAAAASPRRRCTAAVQLPPTNGCRPPFPPPPVPPNRRRSAAAAGQLPPLLPAVCRRRGRLSAAPCRQSVPSAPLFPPRTLCRRRWPTASGRRRRLPPRQPPAICRHRFCRCRWLTLAAGGCHGCGLGAAAASGWPPATGRLPSSAAGRRRSPAAVMGGRELLAGGCLPCFLPASRAPAARLCCRRSCGSRQLPASPCS